MSSLIAEAGRARLVFYGEPGLKPGQGLLTNADSLVHAGNLGLGRSDFGAQRFDPVSQVDPRGGYQSRIHAASLLSACRSM
jgi:hypothetical protein